eukprot:5220295-Amphidinium_carterae.1
MPRPDYVLTGTLLTTKTKSTYANKTSPPQVPNIPTRQSLQSGIRSQGRSFVAQASKLLNQSSLRRRS